MLSLHESLQSIFLNQVKKNLPPHVSFADELAEVLSISRDSAYRRIRGETVLSLDEAKLIYNRFGISLDALLSDSSRMVTFHHRVVNYQEYNLEKWLNSILKNLDYLGSFEKNELIFSAKDIPVFHYFRLPQLSAFKLFFWMKTLFNYPAYEHKKFTPDDVPRELQALAHKVWGRYSALSSTEIWNDAILYDTLKQIEFYYACGLFANPEDALTLCDQIFQLISEIEAEAAAGQKKQGGSFHLYNNEILIADNTVFARMGEQRCVYVNQNSLNLLLTLQEPFCEKTEAYLKTLMKRSTYISVTGEKERLRFFNNIRSQIQGFREKFARKIE